MENERGIRHFPLRYPNCILPNRRGGQWPPVYRYIISVGGRPLVAPTGTRLQLV